MMQLKNVDDWPTPNLIRFLNFYNEEKKSENV